MSRPKVICLTPVKNEAVNLRRFLRCTSLWADHIIIADQQSDDESLEIARAFPKVIVVDNPSPVFNEPERQKLLLDAARNIPGPRLLIALDADEFLTANFMTSPEWETVLQAPPGTVVRFQWPVILEDLRSYWLYPHEFAFGFMDDGSEHSGKAIHSPRLPLPQQAPQLVLKEIRAMHYVGTDPLRWKSKIRWYQCWELLNKHRRPIEIYRFNHKDLNIPAHKIRMMPDDWLSGYERHGIDMTSVSRDRVYRWEEEILKLFSKHGSRTFRRLAIWDVDWQRLYDELHPNGPPLECGDPRSRFDRLVHRWLRRFQPYYSHFRPSQPWHVRVPQRMVHRVLRVLGW